MSNKQPLTAEEAAIVLLKRYTQWEADIISENALWWPQSQKDAFSGKLYDDMLELQAERNRILEEYAASLNTPEPATAHGDVPEAMQEVPVHCKRARAVDVIMGVMYKNSTDEGEEGAWIEGKDYWKVAGKLFDYLTTTKLLLDVDEQALKAMESVGKVYRHLNELNEKKLAEVTADRDNLKAWKESAMATSPDLQAIGRALGIKLGESVHDKILPGIEDLKANRDEWKAKAEGMEAAPSSVGVKEGEQLYRKVIPVNGQRIPYNWIDSNEGWLEPYTPSPAQESKQQLNPVTFLEWQTNGRYIFDYKKGKYVAAWDNYAEYTALELYREFHLQSLAAQPTTAQNLPTSQKLGYGQEPQPTPPQGFTLEQIRSFMDWLFDNDIHPFPRHLPEKKMWLQGGMSVSKDAERIINDYLQSLTPSQNEKKKK